MTKRETLTGNIELREPGSPPPSGYVQPISRRDKVMLNIPVRKEVRDQVRALALQESSTAQAVVYEGLNLLFEKYGKKPIA